MYFCLFAYISYVSYAIYAKKHKTISADYTVITLTSATPLIGLLHYLFETTIIPSTNDFYIFIAIATGPASLAFYCWDYSIKTGSINKISILSCLTPACSILLLIIFNEAQLSINLLFATILLLFSNIIITLKNSN